MGFSCHFPLSFKISLHLDATQAVISVTENYSCTELELIALSTDSRGFLALKMNLLMLLPFLIQTPLTGFLLHIFWLFFLCWQLIIRIHFKMLVLTFEPYVVEPPSMFLTCWSLVLLPELLRHWLKGCCFPGEDRAFQTAFMLYRLHWVC